LSKRRSVGEGSIFKRSDGRWAAQYTDREGRRRNIYGKRGGVNDQREVQRRLRDALVLVNEDAVRYTGKQKLKAFLKDWIEGVQSRGEVAGNTITAYQRAVAIFSESPLADLPLEEIRRPAVQRCFDTLSDKYSPGTLRTRHQALRTALNYAVEMEYIPTNPASKIRLPRLETKEIKVLAPEELRQLIEVSRETPWCAAWVLMGSTGLRVGEATAIEWPSIDFPNKRLSVVSNMQYQDNQLRTTSTKSKRSRRTVPLGSIAVEILQRHQQMQEADRATEFWRGGDLVLPNQIGEPLWRSVVMKALRTDLARAGLRTDISPHDLRHTFATLMFQKGVHPGLVQEWMGHSSIQITMDTYSHIVPSMHDLAGIVMDDILR